MTRALVLTPTIDGHDGLSCLARQMTDALSSTGLVDAVDVWALTESSPAPRAAVAAAYGAGGSRARFVGRAAAEMWSASRPDLVLAMHAHLLPVAVPLVLRGAKLVTTLVGIEAWRRFSPVEEWALARSSRVLAISAHTARGFRASNPSLAGTPIDICRPATPELAIASPGPASRRTPYALIVGRMSADERYKGHDLLIDTWPSLLSSTPDAHLLVAGGGDDAPRLAARAHARGLGASVQFLGAVEQADLSALYRDAALVVLPSTGEGFGFVFLEAMSHGRPCIGAPGAAEEIIEDGVTGFIVDPSQPDALVSRMARLFADPGLRESMGQAGLERAETTFAFSRLVHDLARFIAPVLAPDGAPTPC